MAAEPIVVTIDRDLQDLVPLFMAQRKADQAAIEAALPLRNFESLRLTGHGMTGAGASYGFDRISDLGVRLTDAARAADGAAIEKIKGDFDDYMRRLVVKYM
jgi:hypothetical protein